MTQGELGIWTARFWRLKDVRYTACDTRTREDLFYDHIDKLADAERKAKIEARQAAEAAFRDFLQSGEIITLNTQWRELLETLASEPTYKALDPADALKVMLSRGVSLSVSDMVSRSLKESCQI